MSNRQNFLLGILIGGVAGAVAALLYAPQSGSETREQIKDKAGEAGKRASEVAGGVKESAQKATAKGREFVQAKAAQVKESVQAGRRAAAEKRAELGADGQDPKQSM